MKPGRLKSSLWSRLGEHLVLLLRAAKKFDRDHGFFLASGITFNILMYLIPFTLKAALFASLLWETAKHLFGWYATHLTRYSVIYGSLSTLIIFFFWVYYSAAILLIGGELACLMEKELVQKGRYSK